MACGYGPVFHTVKPALMLDFRGRQNLLDRITGNNYITFTRTGAVGYYFNSTGTLVTATANTPRFDYDPITYQCRGLLIEPQRTNYILQSLNFASLTWSKNTSTAGAATTTPTGTSVNALVVGGTAGTSNYAYCYQQVTWSGTSGAACFSFYIKAGNTTTSCNNFAVRDTSVAGDLIAGSINFTTGVTTIATLSGSPVNSVGGLVNTYDSGKGWWRVMIAVPTGMVSGRTYRLYAGFTGDALRSGGGTSDAVLELSGNSVWLWGGQVEDAEDATTLITTTTGQITRGADVVTLGSFSSWYNTAQGCWLIDSSVDYPSGISVITTNTVIDMRVGASITDQVMIAASSGGTTFMTVRANGTDAYSPFSPMDGTWKSGSFNRFAFNYGTNDSAQQKFTTVFNSNAVSTQNTYSYPTASFTNMGIGSTLGNANYLNGYIRSIAYYNKATADTKLAIMTIGGGTSGPAIEGGSGGGGGGGGATI